MSSTRQLILILAGVGLLYAGVVVVQRWVFDSYQGGYIKAALLAQALADGSAVKREIATHYAEFGSLPQDNQALGLGAPDTFSRDAVREIEVQDGNIVISFNDKVGADASLVLRAKPSESGIGSALIWRCESDTLSAELLASASPQCSRVEKIRLEPAQAESAVVASVEDLVNAMHQRRRGLALQIIQSGINVNATWQGLLPLEMAIEAGDAEIVAALLKAGAKPDRRLARRNRMTLLMYAATINRQSGRIVRTLLQAGASHEARDDMGRSPLMHAAQAGNTTAIEVLLEAGAPIDAIDNSGNSALNYAASHGTSSTVYRRLNNAKHKGNEIIVVIPQRE
jgi:hypothetical protein